MGAVVAGRVGMSLRAPRGDVRVDVRGEARRRTEGPRTMQREPPEIAQRRNDFVPAHCLAAHEDRTVDLFHILRLFLIHSSRHRYHRASLYRTRRVRYSYPGAPYITYIII